MRTLPSMLGSAVQAKQVRVHTAPPYRGSLAHVTLDRWNYGKSVSTSGAAHARGGGGRFPLLRS